MKTITVDDITRSLEVLPPEKLIVVYDFVTYLADRESPVLLLDSEGSALACAMASEAALKENWDRPEEDAAWAHL